MTDKELDSLLDRFASDEITDSEQQQLVNEIMSGPVPAIPDGLEQRLDSTIDSLDYGNRTRRTLTATPRRRFTARILVGIAASVALLIALGVHMSTTPATAVTTPVDTCATPEEAYAEAQKALLIFASALDKGMRQVDVVQATAENVHDKLSKELGRTNIRI